MPWACYQCNFLRSFAFAFDRIDATVGRILMKFWRFPGPFLTQVTLKKLNFPPEQYAHCSVAIKHESLMKIFKGYFEFIRKTLWSGKNWLIYSSFSAITQIKWKSNITFEPFKTLQPTLEKQVNVSIFFFEIRNGMTFKVCASQLCSNHIYRKIFGFFADHAGKIPSISPFWPSKRPFPENVFATFVPVFGRHPSCPRIPIK